MSAAALSYGRPHTGMWLTVPLALLLVYVGSWPVVMIKSTHTASVSRVAVGAAGPYIASTTNMPKTPSWVLRLYQPLHVLSAWNKGNNLLVAYWRWWDARLGYRMSSLGWSAPLVVP
ncbi:hypothetical protein AYO49_05390 [Verrucomicrobiaceae bacterium SCGC AG-212-N21]|nr:hypothetical protein AYO49_05390 [Verrucomicrobiaceae bacterium SCGC AG-212-N21]